MNIREMMARRAALELTDGEVVNLGFGIPLSVADYLPAGVETILQTEIGALRLGPSPKLNEADSDFTDSGAQPVTLLPGASLFDLITSFTIIRGGHIDTTILGALEVDQHGNIANWARPLAPGRYAPGMGGAMDLVGGARKVVVTLQHNDKQGHSKILKNCTLPLTGQGSVNVIITEKAVFQVIPTGLVLKEVAEGYTPEDIRSCTEAPFSISPDCCHYRLA
jgi:acetate CoA/acetoacetate CoA-transferase beta subunit